MQAQYLEILYFTLFYDHTVFITNDENDIEKQLKNEVEVSVGIDMVLGNM